MAEFNMGLLGEFHTILYDEKPLTPEEYLKGTPKGLLIRLATFMIGLHPNSSKFYDWKELLNMWFRTENFEFKKKIWNRCEALEVKENAEISLLSPVASLRFFEFAFSITHDKESQDPAESEINLFKAYLLFLTNETNKEVKSENYLHQLNGKYRIAATLLNQTYPVSDFTNYHLSDILITQVIKAYYLFEFLSKRNECEMLMQKFYDEMGIKDWKDYFQYILPLVNAFSNHPSEGLTQVTVEKNEKYDKSCFFLEALSLKNFDSELDADFKLLRGNPLYKIDEGKYAIISSLFLLEKIYKGLYFKLKEVIEKIPQVTKEIKNFRSFYTSKFSENYLLYEILSYILKGKNYIKYSGEYLSTLGFEGAPDYYIRNGNTVFLFENKDVFINADVKQSFDFKLLEEELKKKFYYEEKQNKITPKAILQIVANVERLLLKQNEFDKNYKERNLKIYPILVLHDSSFNAPGLNWVVNYWFELELAKLEKKGIGIGKVKPITIINVDTFIIYSDYLKDKKDTLNNLIDNFIKFGHFNEKKQYKDFEALKGAYGKSLLAFSFFIDTYTSLGYKKVSESFRNSIFEQIFPKERIEESKIKT